ncbi:3-ketoacyl-CoA thiolase 1, peroxisomal-like [Aristolochia californica]|uniref:3-ketoacyl-CoA thiolase 1, peroxisomal-like n=1 Tax=Aristolochia californica TaxID=171875 RepID=UPI0035D666E8
MGSSTKNSVVVPRTPCSKTAKDTMLPDSQGHSIAMAVQNTMLPKNHANSDAVAVLNEIGIVHSGNLNNSLAVIAQMLQKFVCSLTALVLGLDRPASLDVVVGFPAHVSMRVRRMQACYARFPKIVPIRTTKQQGSSSLQTVTVVAAAILTGFDDIRLGVGFDSMTANPMTQDQDHSTVLSHSQSVAAITPVATKIIDTKYQEEKNVVLYVDDGCLHNVFVFDRAMRMMVVKKDGTIIAGNLSQVGDGASAIIFMRSSVAEQKALPFLGTFSNFTVVGVDPSVMGIDQPIAIFVAVKALSEEVLAFHVMVPYRIGVCYSKRCW